MKKRKRKREAEELGIAVIQKLKEPEAMKTTNAFELRKEITWNFRRQTLRKWRASGRKKQVFLKSQRKQPRIFSPLCGRHGHT